MIVVSKQKSLRTLCRVSLLGARNQCIGVKRCHGNHHATFEDSILDSECNCANHFRFFLLLVWVMQKLNQLKDKFMFSLNLMETFQLTMIHNQEQLQ